jgi:aspartyl-tRNA(Asn)/glutamyl-tRNA(Gln) amidotransferase subunit C
MAITRRDVLHVANLARLELEEEEVERLTRELGNILTYVDQLARVNTDGVEVTQAIGVDALPMRPDESVRGLSHDQALAPAPRVLNEGFAVPAFVDD